MATANTTTKAVVKTTEVPAVSEVQKKEGAALFAEAKVVASSAKDIGKAIHSLCMKMARHAAKYRDVSAMTYFVKLLDEKSKDGKNESIIRVSAVKQWFIDFGYARWVNDKKAGTEGFKLASTKLDEATEADKNKTLAAGNAEPFYKHTVEAPFSPIDSFKAIESLINRLTTKQNDHGVNSKGVDVKNNINPDHIKALVALRDELRTPTAPTLRIPAQQAESLKKTRAVKKSEKSDEQVAA
jgi:hypothetical protein